MQQYHDHLKLILEKGTEKAPAREGMPSSRSYFGHQNRYNLQEGFPIITTKKVPFRWVVVELLWFLRGDTNIKYLDERGVDKMWHEDAYNYYKKIALQNENDHLANILYMGIDKDGQRTNPVSTLECSGYSLLTFEEFCRIVNETPLQDLPSYKDYVLGSCGMQYGALWRKWHKDTFAHIDQIKNLIEGLIENPEGRRHIVTAWNPETLNDMALNACHSFFQMNCRKLTLDQRLQIFRARIDAGECFIEDRNNKDLDTYFNKINISTHYLDCHFYQRSADMFLGVPFNIASYALLTHIIAAICNMVPGELVHSFGDSHIYSNHKSQVDEILSRNPQKYKLPKLKFSDEFKISIQSQTAQSKDAGILQSFFDYLTPEDFKLEGYESYPHISAPLSTGLAK